MFGLVLGVQCFVVGRFGLEHLPKDFEPALSQTAKRTGVRHFLLAFLLVVGFGPDTVGAAEVDPEMDRGSQEFVAGASDSDFVHLAGFEGDGSRAGHTLKFLSGRESLGISRTLGEHAWGEFIAEAWQGTEQFMVGVLIEQFADSAAVEPQLLFEGEQLFGQCDGQAALGCGDGRGSSKALGRRKDLQAFAVGLGPSQAAALEELLPTFFAGTDQLLGGGELDDKLPSGGQSPVVEGLASCRIILVDRLLKLVDQGRSLFNERDLVATEQSEFLDERIVGLERPPGVTIEAQGVGQTPGIDKVVFHPCRHLAFAIACGRLRLNGVDPHTALEQSLDGRSAIGFDGHRQWKTGGDAIAELTPACGGVFELELVDDAALACDDDDVVLVLGPVETGEVEEGVG